MLSTTFQDLSHNRVVVFMYGTLVIIKNIYCMGSESLGDTDKRHQLINSLVEAVCGAHGVKTPQTPTHTLGCGYWLIRIQRGLAVNCGGRRSRSARRVG